MKTLALNNIESKNRVNNKAEHKVTPEVINAHMKALKEQDSQKRKAPAYAVGTRVLCKAYGVMGTVKENNYLYKVEYDSPVDCNGHTYTYGIYGEYGITTNYDEQGREIVGNANYYAYELNAPHWGDSQPRLFHLAGLDITATQHGLVWQVTAKDGDGMINRYALMQTEELAAYLAELYAKEHTPDLDSTGTDNDTLQQPQEIREMPTWCKNGQHVLFEGKLHRIECTPKSEHEHLHEVIIENCETHDCHFERWENLTPCDPDGNTVQTITLNSETMGYIKRVRNIIKHFGKRDDCQNLIRRAIMAVCNRVGMSNCLYAVWAWEMAATGWYSKLEEIYNSGMTTTISDTGYTTPKAA